MIAPAIILLLALVAYPFALSLWLSVTNASIGNTGHFVGLNNYTNQLHSAIFRTAFRNTFWYTAVTTVVKLVLGFALALLLNQHFIGRKFVRAAILLPWIIPSVLSTMAWLWMFDSNLSSLNWLFRHLHLIHKNLPFLTDPNWAMGCVMTVNIWRGTPFLGITILAALQTIPAELYEAASLDGASQFVKFARITIPLVMPVLTVVMIVSIIGTFSDIQIVYALTGGGPINSTQVLSTLSYQAGLRSGMLGQGAAISLYMFPVMLLMVVLQVWNVRRRFAI
ncbi:MAG: sugar ABC transporter permease [Chloroflexota bacterium]|nr:sugar ABC transporter permease [Chloroflexota bacterium]